MKNYLISEINTKKYKKLITLLDYKIQISKILNDIKLPENKIDKVLVDTLICSGLNEYRFIEVNVKEDGKIDLEHYKYIEADNELKKIADDIVRQYPIYLNNSVLPESTIKEILKGDIKWKLKNLKKKL